MRNTLAIAQRQFAAFFNGPIAYIVVCAVLLLLGFFFWETFFLRQLATVRDMFQLLPLFLIVAAPALSMSLLADEKRTGTIELLLTMPVRDSEVIIGKYLGTLGLYVVLLALTLPYPISVSWLGPLDWGQVFSGYFGLLLTGGAMLAIGLLTSSWTDSQIVALFAGAFFCFVFVFLDRVLPLMPQGAASVLEFLAFNSHLQSMTRGVVDSRDVIYFLSVIAFALMFAFRSLESRRWR